MPVQPGLGDPEAVPEPTIHRARVVAIVNQKGGVGKTTTAVSLAAAMAEAGARVLLVDLDPQGNASSGLGRRVAEGSPSTYSVLVDEADPESIAQETDIPGLTLWGSSLDLAGAEIELVAAFNREHQLRLAIEGVRADLDLVLIDCPPSLGLLTLNALVAADDVLVPIQCEYYALEGLEQLHRLIDRVQRNLNPTVHLGGIVLTMFDSRTNLARDVVREVSTHFPMQTFDAIIPRTVRLSEAPSYGQPITTFDPESRGAVAYRALAREFADRHDLPAPVPEPAPAGPLQVPTVAGVLIQQEESSSKGGEGDMPSVLDATEPVSPWLRVGASTRPTTEPGDTA